MEISVIITYSCYSKQWNVFFKLFPESHETDMYFFHCFFKSDVCNRLEHTRPKIGPTVLFSHRFGRHAMLSTKTCAVLDCVYVLGIELVNRENF